MCIGSNTRKIMIEELGERWEMLLWEMGVEKLSVVEQFNRNGLRSYDVIGLSMECEDDFVMCGDLDNSLINNFSILLMFLKQSVNTIYLLPLGNDYYQERIEFNDGVILIERAS